MKIEIIEKRFQPGPIPLPLEKIPRFFQAKDPAQSVKEIVSKLLLPVSFKPFVVYEGSMPESIWFIGDIHADAPSLAETLKYILTNDTGKPHVVFLGDYLDRGTQPFETFNILFTMIFQEQIKAALLAGNHEFGFTFDPGIKHFNSEVRPCDFKDELNRNERRSKPDEALRFWGLFWTSLAPYLKTGLLLPGGVYASHAGFIRESFLPRLSAFINDPSNPEFADINFNLVWMRFQSGVKSDSTGCFNAGHFNKFREAMRTLGYPVEIMVRGHDHPHAGYTINDAPGQIITLNNCMANSQSKGRSVRGTIGIGRYFPGKGLFQVHGLTA